MYSEDETELRDLVIKNLETNGFLNKIKAELRAGVILALEEEDNFKSKMPFFNKKLEDFIGTPEGKIMFSVVREFLEYFNFHFTLSVFDPEVANAYSFLNRDELLNHLDIENKDFEGPILKALLKRESTPKISAQNNNANEEINKINDSVKTTEVNFKTPEFNPSDSLEPNFNDIFPSSKMKMSDIFPTSEIKITDPFVTSEAKISDALSTSKSKISDISVPSKPQISEILMASDAKNTDHDPFFDEPLPTQKPSYFSLDEKLKDNKVQLEKLSESRSPLETSNLSSLKNLPSLVTKPEWPMNKSKTLPSLDPINSVKKENMSGNLQMDKDIFDNEEVSDKQMNSEESIEEEIEEDFSAGIEDILSSSLADDATTDQSISNVSVVDGIDHIEDCKSLN